MESFPAKYFRYDDLPVKWYWFGLGGIIISVFFLLQQFAQHQIAGYNFSFSWGSIGLKHLTNYSMWLIFLPTINLLVNSIRWKPLNRVIGNLLKLTLALIVVASLHRVIASRLIDVFNYFNFGYLREFWGANSRLEITVGIFTSGLEFLIIYFILLALNYQQRFIKQQKELARAQLNALRMQLNPHFLFNTLHSISTLIDLDVKRAQKMITRLGSLLRKVLEAEEKQLITLQDELKFIEEYLDIEQIRFEELEVKYDLDASAYEQLVPNLIMQPLVENAIKYGVIKDGKTEISIRTGFTLLKETTEALFMEIENDTADNQMKKRGTGVGLKNIRKRLEQSYDDFSFEIDQEIKDRFVARIVIPTTKLS